MTTSSGSSSSPTIFKSGGVLLGFFAIAPGPLLLGSWRRRKPDPYAGAWWVLFMTCPSHVTTIPDGRAGCPTARPSLLFCVTVRSAPKGSGRDPPRAAEISRREDAYCRRRRNNAGRPLTAPEICQLA